MAAPATEAIGRVVEPAGSDPWRANQDFNMRNLRVKAGEVLPSRWQHPELIDYLKRTYGADCVIAGPTRARRAARNAKPTNGKTVKSTGKTAKGTKR